MSLAQYPWPTSFSEAEWRRKSTEGSCVEVNYGTCERVAVRDSKDPGGAVLVFERSAWRDFLAAVRGDFPSVR
ncbi:DUF397 domain-containing protein [Saccharopolyspora sp. MS10]|uniref:DUF397 domain-containing protein n=1 Tax=Saccharopolyspora sp. MS10 TaxID=3385973 RepID=UPI0039A1BF18